MASWLRVFTSRIAGWLKSDAEEREFEDEIQDHLDRLTEEHIQRGMDPRDAARMARVRLGGVSQLKEDQRARRGLPQIDTSCQDVRFAIRMFAKSPGFTLLAVLTVAVGIAVNTVVFTLVNAAAFKRLPVADADDLFRLERSFQSGARGDVQYAFSFEEYSYYRIHGERLAGILAASWPASVMTELADAPLQGQLVSDDYFVVLGVSAEIGRTFRPEENRVPGGSPVIVLADAFWRRQFHADPSAIGRTIVLNGTTFTILGVAPQSFIGTGNPPQVPDFWAPLMMQAQLEPGRAWLDRPGIHRLQLLVRVKPGFSPREAAAELQVLGGQLTEQPETHSANDRTIALALQPASYFGGIDDIRFAEIVALLMTAVSMILLVACANLANMLLARGTVRQKEIAMRLALGASRGRIVRQLLTESLLLAVLGGAAGLLLSFWGSHATWAIVEGLLRIMFLADRPFLASVTPDSRILAFTIVLSLATGVLFGLAPALKISRSDVSQALKDEGMARGRRRLSHSWLVGGQMAISMTFLVCAGLLLKGLARAQTIDVGFDTARVFVVLMNFGNDPAQAARDQQRLVDTLADSPDIRSVALTDRFPFAGTWSPPVTVDDPSSAAGKRTTRTLANYVSPNYFQTMGIAIARGRTFATSDEQERTSAIVSESAARRLWPNDDPIGKRLTLDMDFRGHLAEFEVVGIAKDVSSANVSRRDPAYVYLSIRSGTAYNLLLRSNADTARVLSVTTQAIQSIEGRVPADVRVMRLKDSPFIRVQLAMPAMIAPFVLALACVALLLAGIGIYGVTSYITSLRTREIGIRMALGAVATNVQLMMVRQAFMPVMIGAALGLLGAAALSQVLQSTLVMPSSPDLLFGVAALDPDAFIGMFAFAMLVAVAASYAPTRRATAVDPLAALRCE